MDDKQKEAPSQKRTRVQVVTKTVGILAIVGGLGLAGFYFGNTWMRVEPVYYSPPIPEEGFLEQEVEKISSQEEESTPLVSNPAENVEEEPEIDLDYNPITVYPVGEIVPSTQHRLNYRDGDLQLYIPRFESTYEIYDGRNGITEETLKRGPELFSQAQLPEGKGVNSNTIIAGSRDKHGQEFYDLETLEPGDELYLLWRGALFTYRVEETLFTDFLDWAPFEAQAYPVLTLQSSHPIGTGTARIYVVSRMTDAVYATAFPGQGGP